MSYESFKDMKKVNVKQEGRPRSGSPDSVSDIDVSIAANQAASNMESLDLGSFLAIDATPGSDLDKLKKAMRAYKQDQTEENENKVAEIFDEMINKKDENVGKTKIPPRKRYVLNDFKKVFFGKWRRKNTLNKKNNPAFFGGRRRKTRKRRGGQDPVVCTQARIPDEWCKQKALTGKLEDNENTMCNLETRTCVKPPPDTNTVPRAFRSPQGIRALGRIRARQARQARQARRQVTAGGRKKRKTRKRRRKKRTKKKTRRKRRKSRKRKTKRRR